MINIYLFNIDLFVPLYRSMVITFPLEKAC